MSYNPHDWSDGIPDCIIFASTADAERGAAMYRSMADALDAQAERIKALEYWASSCVNTMESTVERMKFAGKSHSELDQQIERARALVGEK